MMKYFGGSLLLLIFFSFLGCQKVILTYKRPLLEHRVIKSQSGKNTNEVEYPYKLKSLQPQFRPDPKSLEAGLWMSVEKAENRTKTAGNRINNLALNQYLEEIVCRLVKDFCQDIRVYVIRLPVFNASMYPNGMMHIWSGLLLRVQNEAQLAAVLGHEIGHYLRRHSLQRFEKIRDTSNVLTFAQIGLAVAGIGQFRDLVTLGALASLSSYSRDHEREADGFGLLFMAKAGYDPGEASNIWKRLVEEGKSDPGYKRPPIFQATHPQSTERMKVLEMLASQIRKELSKNFENGRERYENIVLPMRAQFLRDELRLRKFKRSKILIDMLIKDGSNVGELYYFKGELYRARNEKKDPQEALRWYKKSIDEGFFLDRIFRSMALVHRKLGNTEEAILALKEYIRLNPAAEDIELIKSLIERL